MEPAVPPAVLLGGEAGREQPVVEARRQRPSAEMLPGKP